MEDRRSSNCRLSTRELSPLIADLADVVMNEKTNMWFRVSTSNGTVHAKTCIIDRAVAGSGPQEYDCNSGIGLPAPVGWAGDPVTSY